MVLRYTIRSSYKIENKKMALRTQKTKEANYFRQYLDFENQKLLIWWACLTLVAIYIQQENRCQKVLF